ncbi:DinB family protein [Halodesulfovibrio aestuarii]
MMHSTHDHKIELLKTLSSLNKQYAGILRRKPPGEDRWSPIMVLEHIVLAERSLLGGLPEPEDMELLHRTFAHKISYAITSYVFNLQLLLPVPELAMYPKGEYDIYELTDMWDENHAWLRSFITEAPRECLSENYFRHQIAGPMNIEQVMGLNLAHIVMHEFQLSHIFMELNVETSHLPYESSV